MENFYDSENWLIIEKIQGIRKEKFLWQRELAPHRKNSEDFHVEISMTVRIGTS